MDISKVDKATLKRIQENLEALNKSEKKRKAEKLSKQLDFEQREKERQAELKMSQYEADRFEEKMRKGR